MFCQKQSTFLTFHKLYQTLLFFDDRKSFRSTDIPLKTQENEDGQIAPQLLPSLRLRS